MDSFLPDRFQVCNVPFFIVKPSVHWFLTTV